MLSQVERATRDAAVWALCVPELRAYRDHLPDPNLATAKWGLRQQGAYEKYFLHKVRAAKTEPYYEKMVLKMLGAKRLKEAT